jgi:microcystin synthetase protein McyJ
MLMDAAGLGFGDSVFDAVVSVEAAFHFITRCDFFAEAQRVLKPNGSLALSDILFGSREAARAFGAVTQDSTGDINAYRDRLVECGFGNVVIEEAIEPCWNAFWTRFEDWFEGERETLNLPCVESAMWAQLLPVLRQGAVSNYLLATARKL